MIKNFLYAAFDESTCKYKETPEINENFKIEVGRHLSEDPNTENQILTSYFEKIDILGEFTKYLTQGNCKIKII